MRNTFKGLRGRTSSGRLVLVPSNPFEQLNRALAKANPQKAEPRSCMVFELKPMGKLITPDKYLSVRKIKILHDPRTQTYGKTNNS